MEVAGLTYSPRPVDPNSDVTGNADLGKEEFLRLLVTQLSNQDPMNPMDGQEFAAQLAQFSSVEQLINIDRTLGQQGEMNALLAQSMNNGVAAGMIGQTIEAPGAALSWTGTEASTVGYDLSKVADSVTITIKDPGGAVIRTIELSETEAGDHTFSWDGTDANGATVSPGAYSFSVEATDAEGEQISVDSAVRGEVTRVTFGSDGIQLWIGEIPISMGDVRSVTES